MKSFFCFLTACCVVLVMAGGSFAQTGTMALYRDEAGTDCNLYDSGTTCPMQVYVIYKGPLCTTASEFLLEQVGGAALIYLGESVDPAGTSHGRADTGLAVAYGAYLSSPVLVATVTYMGLGVSCVCSQLCIKPYPNSSLQNGDFIRMVDCQFAAVWANPGHMTINPDDDCECKDPGGSLTPVEAASWGKIKALYVN